MAVDAVSFSEDLLDLLGIMAEVVSEARRCAGLPCTVDRFGTVDDFTSLEARDVKELSTASSRVHSKSLFLDSVTSLVASSG